MSKIIVNKGKEQDMKGFIKSHYMLLLLGMVTATEIGSCSKLVHLARAEQSDVNGLKCWDAVKVPTCGGRCDSSEIADWEFPFKKSHHPVCMFGARRLLSVRLRNCDPGVASGTELFHFVAADDCRCREKDEQLKKKVNRYVPLITQAVNGCPQTQHFFKF